MSESAEVLEENKEERKEELEQKTAELSAKVFFQGDHILRSAGKNKKVSTKGLVRALRAALHKDVSDARISFTTDVEAELASTLVDMLTARTILQAHLIKQHAKQAEEANNGKKESEQKLGESGNLENEGNRE